MADSESPYYTLRIYKFLNDMNEHILLGGYALPLGVVPWVPRQGEFFRFCDHRPPGMAIDHTETAGRVEEIVTVFYRSQIVIEIYLRPRRNT